MIFNNLLPLAGRRPARKSHPNLTGSDCGHNLTGSDYDASSGQGLDALCRHSQRGKIYSIREPDLCLCLVAIVYLSRWVHGGTSGGSRRRMWGVTALFDSRS